MLITWGLQDQYLSRRDIAHSRAVSHQSSQELHSRYTQTNREYPPIDCNLYISFSRWQTSTSLSLLDMYEIWHVQTHTDRKREWQRVCVCVWDRSSSSIPHISSKESSCLLKNLYVPFVRTDQENHPDDAWATDDSPDHYDTEADSKVKAANPSTSWWRRHHKGCSCEPYATHPWHSTLILHELHLAG